MSAITIDALFRPPVVMADDLRNTVTEVEANAALDTLRDASSLTDEELNDAIAESVDRVREHSDALGIAIYERLLPLLTEAKTRYGQQGRKTRLNGQPSYYEYLESIGLNPATVLQWRHRSIEHNLVEHLDMAEDEAMARSEGNKTHEANNVFPAQPPGGERAVRAGDVSLFRRASAPPTD